MRNNTVTAAVTSAVSAITADVEQALFIVYFTVMVYTFFIVCCVVVVLLFKEYRARCYRVAALLLRNYHHFTNAVAFATHVLIWGIVIRRYVAAPPPS